MLLTCPAEQRPPSIYALPPGLRLSHLLENHIDVSAGLVNFFFFWITLLAWNVMAKMSQMCRAYQTTNIIKHK